MTQEIVRELVDGEWVTRVAAQGGGGGSQTLAQTLALGNDANSLKITGLADGVDPQDAATVAQTGGSAVTSRAEYGGNSVTIANGATGVITWDTKYLGDDLLDLTDPENPAVIIAGVYIVTVAVASSEPLTAAGEAQIAFDMDNDGDDPNTLSTFPGSGAGGMSGSVTIAYYIPAGGTLHLRVKNFDGASSRDFNLTEAVVQRVS